MGKGRSAAAVRAPPVHRRRALGLKPERDGQFSMRGYPRILVLHPLWILPMA